VPAGDLFRMTGLAAGLPWVLEAFVGEIVAAAALDLRFVHVGDVARARSKLCPRKRNIRGNRNDVMGPPREGARDDENDEEQGSEACPEPHLRASYQRPAPWHMRQGRSWVLFRLLRKPGP